MAEKNIDPRTLATSSRAGVRPADPDTVPDDDDDAGDDPKAASTNDRAGKKMAPRASTRAQQKAFLKAFSALGIVTAAADQAGIDRGRHYEWLRQADKYPDYPDRFAQAESEAVDRCELAMIKRGVIGWDEPVYQGGQLVGMKRMFSDAMLLAALKARRPEKFRERFDHTSNNQTITPVVVYLPDNGRG